MFHETLAAKKREMHSWLLTLVFEIKFKWGGKVQIILFALTLTKDVTKIHTGSEGGFRGWGQSDTSWVYQWYKVSKNVFGKAVLSLVAEFQK